MVVWRSTQAPERFGSSGQIKGILIDHTSIGNILYQVSHEEGLALRHHHHRDLLCVDPTFYRTQIVELIHSLFLRVEDRPWLVSKIEAMGYINGPGASNEAVLAIIGSMRSILRAGNDGRSWIGAVLTLLDDLEHLVDGYGI